MLVRVDKELLYDIFLALTHGSLEENSPDTILQLMVMGWKDFPGDSEGLGAWLCCGTILQLPVIGWKAELPWEPSVIFSVSSLGRDVVRSEHGVRPDSVLTATPG